MSIRIGMLTPSSNTVLEPVTVAMIRDLPDVSAHFARFEVRSIALDAPALAQFDTAPMVAAAEQLAHARVDVIAWNGTSAGWMGFAADERLCNEIHAATGVTAVTTVLGLNSLLRQAQRRRVAFVTPYTDDVQARIVEQYEAAGFDVVAERHLAISDNFSFGEVSASVIEKMIRDAAESGADVVIPFCTNLAAAPLVDRLERELNIPIFDSVAVTVWAALAACGYDLSLVRGWGQLFSVPLNGAVLGDGAGRVDGHRPPSGG